MSKYVPEIGYYIWKATKNGKERNIHIPVQFAERFNVMSYLKCQYTNIKPDYKVHKGAYNV